MFKTAICKTDFADMATVGDSSGIFGHITGNSYGSDVSFVSTLRALLYTRMPKDEFLSFRISASPINATQDDLEVIADGIEHSGVGTLKIVTVYPDRIDNCEKFSEYNTNWHRLEKVTAFFRKQLKAICFINTEVKSTVIFVDTLNAQTIHYLQCGIFAYLPWYFDAEKGVSEPEMELINSLREKTPGLYIDALNRIAESMHLDAMRVKTMLAGFETAYERAEIQKVKANIQSTVNNINSLMNQIGAYLKQKNDYETRLIGLETKITQAGGEDSSEIQEFFLCNKKVLLENVIGTSLIFGVRDYLRYFDEDRAKAYIENFNSSLYRFARTVEKDKLKKLYESIFVTQDLKIKFCACYTIRIDGGVNANADYNFGPSYNGYKPNPHINRYSCMGDYGRTIIELLKEHNYIGAIEQCIASCGSLNFGDPTVLDTFCSGFVDDIEKGNSRKYIELPDGSAVSPAEALDYVVKEEDNNG